MEEITERELTHLKKIVFEKIRTYIFENQLQPGDRIPTERELAEKLGVSRNVVREALGTLEAMGYIAKRQGKGIFIKEPDLSFFFQEMLLLWGDEHSRFKDILQFRMMLEQAALTQIAGKTTEDAIQRLYGLVDASERDKGSIAAFIKHDYLFHKELLHMTGNPFIIQLTDVINQYFQMIASKEEEINASLVENTIAEHRSIVERLQKNDLEGLLTIMRAHFRFN